MRASDGFAHQEPRSGRQLSSQESGQVYDHRNRYAEDRQGANRTQEPARTSRKHLTARERFQRRDGIDASMLPWTNYYVICRDYPFQSIKSIEADKITEKIGRSFNAVVIELNKEKFPDGTQIPEYFKKPKLQNGIIKLVHSQKPTAATVYINESVLEEALEELVREQKYTGDRFPELRFVKQSEISQRLKSYVTAVLTFPFENVSLKDLKAETREMIVSSRGINIPINDWHEIERVDSHNGTTLRILVDHHSAATISRCRGTIAFRHRILQINESKVKLEGKSRPQASFVATNINSTILPTQTKHKQGRTSCLRTRWSVSETNETDSSVIVASRSRGQAQKRTRNVELETEESEKRNKEFYTLNYNKTEFSINKAPTAAGTILYSWSFTAILISYEAYMFLDPSCSTETKTLGKENLRNCPRLAKPHTPTKPLCPKKTDRLKPRALCCGTAESPLTPHRAPLTSVGSLDLSEPPD